MREKDLEDLIRPRKASSLEELSQKADRYWNKLSDEEKASFGQGQAESRQQKNS